EPNHPRYPCCAARLPAVGAHQV
ncbi:MAG: hypothetical protein AVDCRST_MAG56-6705, partial [uncultured Cytophagales bacterium]